LLGHFLAGTRRTSGFEAKYFRTVKNDREKDQPARMVAERPYRLQIILDERGQVVIGVQKKAA
jgi:hypothetical protein